jgi:hypothetical protein
MPKDWAQGSLVIGRALALSLLASASSLACSGYASGADTAQQFLPVDPAWACLNQAPGQLPVLSPIPKYIVYAVPIFDYANPPTPVAGLNVAACQVSDTNCPVANEVGLVQPPTPYMTTIGGVPVTVPLYQIVMPYGVDAYLRLSAPGYVTGEYLFGGPLVSLDGKTTMLPDGTLAAVLSGLPITPLAKADADRFANSIGITRDPNAAIIAMRTIDCNGELAAGCSLSLSLSDSPGVVPFATDGIRALSANPPKPTDASGYAGFANIPLKAGLQNFNVTVVGKNAAGEVFSNSALEIRPGFLTTGQIRPSLGLYGR